MSSNGQGADRRRFGRRDSSLAAALVLRGQRPQPCTIINYSASGALVEVREATISAQMVRLVIDSHGIDLVCQVRHKSQSLIGVTFVGGSIERFNATFKPQSIMPQAPRAKAVEDPVIDVPAKAQAASAHDPSETGSVGGSSRTPGAEASNVAAAGPECHDPLSRLDRVLMDIAEFSAAGFRAELSLDGCSLIIFQRMVRRGHWYLADSGLVWISATIGLDDMEASSVDVATLRTMQLVLKLIERRQRTVGTGGAGAGETPHSQSA